MRHAATTALAAAATAVSYAVVHDPRSAEADTRLARTVAAPRGDAVDRLVAATTDLGSVYALAGAATVLAALGRRRAAMDVLGAGMTAWGVAQGAKPLAGRERPYQADGSHRLVAEPAGSSWPSGHVAVATAVGAVTAERGGTAAAAFGAGLSAFVGFSRVYVGVHYPSDVLGGVGLGWLSARLWARAAASTTAARAVRRAAAWRRSPGPGRRRRS